MKLFCESEQFTLYHGSMLDITEAIDDNSIDSIVTDPPYELNFMNKGWDNTGIAFQKDTWKKCYQVLKPGGYLLAFGGSRTFHRIACAIEDAGFEIRDTIMWLYGSGFPKSHNVGLDVDKLNGFPERGHRIAVANRKHPDGTIEPNGEYLPPYEAKTIEGKKWSGWGTALKPSYEPIIVARKPIEETVAKNCMKYGVGGINIDECRVDYNGEIPNIGGRAKHTRGDGYGFKALGEDCVANTNGRFPANTILTYDETDFDEVCGGFPNTKSTPRTPTKGGTGGIGKATNFQRGSETSYFNDSGSAVRYFYCAKASKKDRDEGLEIFEEKTAGERTNRKDGSAGISAYAGATGSAKNFHPTVKPTELMQYLIRLVAPPGSTILDPFNGSGSTGKAVMFENREKNKNYHYIGVDLSEEYLKISKARIEYAAREYEPEEVLKVGKENAVQTTLF